MKKIRIKHTDLEVSNLVMGCMRIGELSEKELEELTETYLSLRRLENRVLLELAHGQVTMYSASESPIQISISQFYGIEINDFAVTVAKTALWIAESQMMKETEKILLVPLDFLPLKTNAYIVEGNAL